MFIKIHPLLTEELIFPKKLPDIIPRESSPSVETQNHHEIVNNKNEYTVSIDVPGVKLSDLSVTVDANSINVSGVRRRTSLDGETIKKSSFSKSFAVDPQTVDLSKLQANLSDGVLVITAPKIEKPLPRAIEITTNPSIEPEKTEKALENDEAKDKESKASDKTNKKK